MRKAIERVFGILKKRFRILKIPLPCYDIMQVVDIMHSCFILHNMILEDKDRLNLGHLVDDWCDKGPDASKARRALYDRANGRTFLLNGQAYLTNDNTDFMVRGKQSRLPDWCDATGTYVPTERCKQYASTRHLVVEHFEIVNNPMFEGAREDKAMWLLPAAVTRTEW